MITYDELNTQNHKIIELSNVLSILLKDRSLCDSETCCDLFYSYMDRVNNHITKVDASLYGPLLQDDSTDANTTAQNFMSGSKEIKKIMGAYVKKWCDKKQHGIAIGAEHDTFIKETNEMFEMVLSRIQDETERLYPMVRNLQKTA